MPAEQVRAFAPGRVNLIGEHTDYNGGLALPFAIAQGVTVSAGARASPGAARIEAHAEDLGERDEFAVGERAPDGGWRAFVRGAAGELRREGWVLPSTELQIAADLPRGAGLSSSAALEVALCLALIELAREPLPPARSRSSWPACAPAWRTIGSEREPGCWTSSRACAGSPTTPS